MENASTALKGCEGGLIRVGARRDNGRVIIEFEDNGPGIAKERQKTLFDFGFIEKDSGRMGLRLGLPFSKRWVEEADGELSVDSEIGRGTKVRIALPVFSG